MQKITAANVQATTTAQDDDDLANAHRWALRIIEREMWLYE